MEADRKTPGKLPLRILHLEDSPTDAMTSSSQSEPLLAVILLVALSIAVALRGLRAVLRLLSSAGLRLAIWRKRRLWNKRASEGMVDAPQPLEPVFRYGKGY